MITYRSLFFKVCANGEANPHFVIIFWVTINVELATNKWEQQQAHLQKQFTRTSVVIVFPAKKFIAAKLVTQVARK